MKPITRTFYISAYKAGKEMLFNNNRHKVMYATLLVMGYDPVECMGCYQGQTEQSFAIAGDNNDEIKLLELAKSYDQESILAVYNDGVAELIYANSGDRRVIGKMKCIGGEDGDTKEMINGRDYTFIAGKYYVVE